MRLLLKFSAAVLSFFGVIQAIGLTGTQAAETFTGLGLDALINAVIARPMAAFLLCCGSLLSLLLWITRQRTLYIGCQSQELIVSDDDRAELHIVQSLLAYTDNVTAMFSKYEPDTSGQGSIDKQNITLSLQQAGQTPIPETLEFEGSPTKGWIVVHRFGAPLRHSYWLPWRHIERRGQVVFNKSFRLADDYYEATVQNYQVGRFDLSVSLPDSGNWQVSVEARINHGIIDLHVDKNPSHRSGYKTYKVSDRPMRGMPTTYRIRWKKL